MKKLNKNIFIHLGIVLFMFLLSCVYFSPVLSGKIIRQGDIEKFEAMVKENKDYHDETGDYTYWNSSMFSGMPSYQIGATKPAQNILNPVRKLLTLDYLGWSRNIGILFIYLIGFYIALIALGISPWLSLLGALAFGLGSYNIIIIEAGHITKAAAMSMIMPIFAGLILCLRPKSKQASSKYSDYVWGGILFAISLYLQISFNHIQITYYTLIGSLCLGIVHLVYAIIDKRFKDLAIAVVVLLVGSVFAVGCNAKFLMTSQQYAQYTMRGGNDITVTPEDLYHDGEPESISGKTSGLNIDYAFSWSYGKGETYTLLVPGAMGGGSGESVDKNSASYKAFRQTQVPLYWGDQPFTSGPVYFGAIIIFLFLVGLILAKGPERWWILAATIIAILMSWGRNFMPFNEWLFNHLPLYNKFRTPSMSLVLANVAVVFLAVLGLKQLLSEKIPLKRKNIALYISGGVTLLILFVGMVLGSGLSYSGLGDSQMAAQYGDQWGQIQSVFIQDRKDLFMHDSWRSVVFIALALAALWLFINKLKNSRLSAAIISVFLIILVVADLWGVDRRYLNEKNFVKSSKTKLIPDSWDGEIDRQAALYNDKDYRVFNLAVNTFNDSKPSAFHHQVGGYSAVKLRRYQDVIDFYLSRHINPQVLNMLNTRYIVMNNGQVQRNPDALGNAWFVDDVKKVDNANDEIISLKDFNPAATAVVNTDEFEIGNIVSDSNDFIETEYHNPYNPSLVSYRTHTSANRLAVFSEIYYKPDWFAYIDGKPADYIRVNYILRGIEVPAGDHVIEFRNEAPLAATCDLIEIVTSILLLLAIFCALFFFFRKKNKDVQVNKPDKSAK
ncbi:MAG: hypothetical protein K5867_11170 [Bacteroidales bacterium]|nr:hypothetical protein [Bacteroidales bacterium]